jgi:DMSO/TMAO reductase YedYZ molybdopterin-dependent catalytic subunit
MSTSRRKWLTAGLTATGTFAGLAAAARLADRFGLVPPDHGGLYGAGETLNYAAQRLVGGDSLAREFTRSQISTPFANGKPPQNELFQRHISTGFDDWRLEIDGMVAHPGSYTIPEIKSLPRRSQITHLACEEGWSFIAEWTGAPLSSLLEAVGVRPEAKFVVYYSFQKAWWDSMDMREALHPQTYIAYGMNGGDLPIGHGGPLRMRVPRQLGYKSVKYINRLTVTDSLKDVGNGLGSAAPGAGYAWYAGI